MPQQQARQADDGSQWATKLVTHSASRAYCPFGAGLKGKCAIQICLHILHAAQIGHDAGAASRPAADQAGRTDGQHRHPLPRVVPQQRLALPDVRIAGQTTMNERFHIRLIGLDGKQEHRLAEQLFGGPAGQHPPSSRHRIGRPGSPGLPAGAGSTWSSPRVGRQHTSARGQQRRPACHDELTSGPY